MTTHPNDNPKPKINDPQRTNSPTMWAIGGVFFVALLAALFIYNGSDNYPKSGENPPPKNMVTGAGQK